MIIRLIRHGKTYANERNLYSGHTDSFVSYTGLNEIRERKVAGLYGSPVALNFASPLIRTYQTFYEIYGNTNFVQIKEFVEFDFGLLEMKTHEDVFNIDGYKEWINPGNVGAACPGGENNIDFNKRVMTKFHEIKDLAIKEQSDVSIVCHGGVIATIMFTLFKEERDHFYKWLPKGGEGYILSFDSLGKITEYSNMSLR